MRSWRKAQHGVVLVIALIVMVSMTLAAIALVRSVDSGVLIAANLAFRQSATLAAEASLKNASDLITDISLNTPTDLEGNMGAYWANAQHGMPNPFNPLTYNWEPGGISACVPADCSKDAAGNTARYVVHRLCNDTGPVSSTNCVRRRSSSGTTGNSVVDYRRLYPAETEGALLYRVTVRVTGPRNTTSHVQAVLY
jgi:type IV pilus assembly protein PilX